MNLETKWDKTFPKSEKVNHKKVTFHNRYGIELVADLYEPKNYEGKLAAIAVCGPFGAVTASQVILRWNLQRKISVIPGSSNINHIKENMNIYHFLLTDEEMKAIEALNRDEKHDWY